MQDIGSQAISALRDGPAFITIDRASYDDLVKRSNLADLLADKIIALEDQNRAIFERLAKAEENLGIQAALIAKLKAKQEHKPKDTKLLDELYKIMQARGLKQVDFATAARMVKRSKARMLQLKPDIGEDMRFVLMGQKNKLVVRLR